MNSIDELPEAQRPAAVAWLSQLIGLFPGAGYVLATRPGALDVTSRPRITGTAQLQELGFVTAELEPMDPVLVRQFVTQWHAAVKAGLTDETARKQLAVGETKLIATIGADSSCAAWPDTPLLAGLSLHARRASQASPLPKRARRDLRDHADHVRQQGSRPGHRRTRPSSSKAASNRLLGDLALSLVVTARPRRRASFARRVIAASAASLPGAPRGRRRPMPAPSPAQRLLREPSAASWTSSTAPSRSPSRPSRSSARTTRAAGPQPSQRPVARVVVLAAGQGNTQRPADCCGGCCGSPGAASAATGGGCSPWPAWRRPSALTPKWSPRPWLVPRAAASPFDHAGRSAEPRRRKQLLPLLERQQARQRRPRRSRPSAPPH